MQLLTIYGTKIQSQQLVKYLNFRAESDADCRLTIELLQYATFSDDFQTL